MMENQTLPYSRDIQTVEPPKDDLPVETIIIVACVCGGVVVILAIILGILCCRRYKGKKIYQQPQAGVRVSAPVPAVKANGHVDSGLGIVNPGMDSIDMDDLHRAHQHSPVYTTDMAGNMHYPNNYHRNYPNGYYGHGGMDWDDRPPPYEHTDTKHRPHTGTNDDCKPHVPRRKSPTGYLAPDDPYNQGHNNSKEGSNGSDSGVSTPDPVKPKKVIYEVIV